MSRPAADPSPQTGAPDHPPARPLDGPAAASPADPPPADPPEGSAKLCGHERPWRVAAWVAPADVPRLATALGPAAALLPCDSMAALAAAVRGGAPAAVVGAACVTEPDVASLVTLMAGHPATVFAGLAGPAAHPDYEAAAYWAAHEAVNRLWRAGLLAVCFPYGPAAWQALNRSLAAARLADPVQRTCVAAVLEDIWGEYRTDMEEPGLGAPTEAGLFRLFACAFGPGVDTVGDVAADLGVDVAALEAWFVHHGLPDVTRYVAAARLVRGAWAGEPLAPGAVAAATRPADPDEPAYIHQNVRRLRRLRRLAAVRGSAASARSAGTAVLNSYRAALVVPFWDALSRFDPASGQMSADVFGSGWSPEDC